VPEQVLDQLRHATGGVPLYIVEVVHALRAGGAIRPRPATGDFYIASDDLLQSVGDAARGAAGGARLGRAAAARGRADEARALLGWLREQCPEDIERPSVRAILRSVELLIQSPAADDPAERDALLAETRESAPLDELRDAASHAAARAVAAGRWDEARRRIAEARRRIAEAAAGAADSPLWQGRLTELRARLPPAPGDAADRRATARARPPSRVKGGP